MAAYGHAGDGNIHVNILFDEKIAPHGSIVTQAVTKQRYVRSSKTLSVINT
jgi:FAD/FMN-containing dehydrogenase